ncbi:TIR domain-containing adapter molecule 1 [Diretmus argenteus]
MDQIAAENQGTVLADVFRILTNVPQERLVSLTFQLGKTPEEDIVHALCLIVLNKGGQALDKLQTLKDNYLANHLAEKGHISGGKLEDFRLKCGHVQPHVMLIELARIFKVLSNNRLCDPLLRDLAYQRALSDHSHKTSDHMHPEYTCLDQLREEAKQVCGPQLAEETCSSRELRSVSCDDPHLGKGSESTHSFPSSLQTSPSFASYPTHLEISEPPTDIFRGDRITSGHPHTCATALVSDYEVKNATGPSNASPLESNDTNLPKAEDSKDTQGIATLAAKCSKVDGHINQNLYKNQTTAPATEPKSAAAATTHFPPEVNVPKEPSESKGAEEEEEVTFYSFVILHAAEDEDMAESMKEKLESIVVGEGATFSGDFEIPGKSTLMCIEDAINNSAFTILLLTRNFSTGLLEVEADSALINSIYKKHKHNTVIPLLPKENCMPRQSMPIVLQRLVALEENKSFERKLKNALSQAKIAAHKKVWDAEQRVKEQLKRQERLKLSNKHQEQFAREHRAAEMLEQERWRMEHKLHLFPNVPADDGSIWLPPQSNIHIENAKYIMIGNDSQMTVSLDNDSEEKL